VIMLRLFDLIIIYTISQLLFLCIEKQNIILSMRKENVRIKFKLGLGMHMYRIKLEKWICYCRIRCFRAAFRLHKNIKRHFIYLLFFLTSISTLGKKNPHNILKRFRLTNDNSVVCIPWSNRHWISNYSQIITILFDTSCIFALYSTVLWTIDYWRFRADR